MVCKLLCKFAHVSKIKHNTAHIPMHSYYRNCPISSNFMQVTSNVHAYLIYNIYDHTLVPDLSKRPE